VVDEVTCDVPRCRQPLIMHYYGRKVCDKHWVEHCEGKINLKLIFNIVDKQGDAWEGTR
jgi:hypothetical protein